MRALVVLAALACATVATSASAPPPRVSEALAHLEPPGARAMQEKQLKLGASFKTALVAARFSDETLIFAKPIGKKWPDQEKFVATAMKNLGLSKAKGKTDAEVVLAAITNPAVKAPLNVPVAWLLEAAVAAPSYKDAVPYLKAAEAELGRQLKVAEQAGGKLGPVLDGLVPELTKAHITADEQPAFNKLTKDKQYEKLSALIGAKDAKKRTANEKKFLDTLPPYQLFTELRRGTNALTATIQFAESKM